MTSIQRNLFHFQSRCVIAPLPFNTGPSGKHCPQNGAEQHRWLQKLFFAQATPHANMTSQLFCHSDTTLWCRAQWHIPIGICPKHLQVKLLSWVLPRSHTFATVARPPSQLCFYGLRDLPGTPVPTLQSWYNFSPNPVSLYFLAYKPFQPWRLPKLYQ